MNRQEIGQSLNLKVEMVDEGRPNRPGSKIVPDYITIHNTSNNNPGADADAHSRMIRNKGYYLHNGAMHYVSWHYTVDDNCVIKHLPVHERAWHAGSGNSQSIGIEICMHAEINQQAANDRASRLVAALMHDLNIKKENIVTHKHWTGKSCPTLLLNDFVNFQNICDGACAAIEEPVVANSLVEAEELAIVNELRDQGYFESLSSEEPDEDPEEAHDLISIEVQNFIKE